jgi:glycine/D-amino acid oxidase-like deaminating enzyme
MEKTEKDISLWLATTPETDFPALTGDITVDVAIVGGGITGVTTAFFLKRAGFTVALIDKKKVVSKTTGNTTAKVTSLHILKYAKLIQELGQECAQIYADANQYGIEAIERIIREESDIDCDFARSDCYTFAEDEAKLDKIQDEVTAAITLGLPASFEADVPLPFATFGGIKFGNQARFHPRKYLLPLVKKIPGYDSYVFENTKALTIEETDHLTVVCDHGRIHAKWVVQASHKPFFDPDEFYKKNLGVYTDYAMAVKVANPTPPGMFISSNGEFSLRHQPTSDGDLLIIGGEGQKGEQEEFDATVLGHYEHLEKSIREKFEVQDIPYRWYTYDFGTPDRVPYIGRMDDKTENIFVATGFAGWGMTTGTFAARMITDAIEQKPNPWQALFEPKASWRSDSKA